MSEDEIDDEIKEIFIEEAEEVIEQINEFFPQWKNGTNAEAKIEVRRAFHTLKGSGRMVRAAEVSELAWSVEDLLNRVLDGAIEINDAIFELVEKVRQIVPALVQAYKAGEHSGIDVETLKEYAETLKGGGLVSIEDIAGAGAVKVAQPAEQIDAIPDETVTEDLSAEMNEKLVAKVEEISTELNALRESIPDLEPLKEEVRSLKAQSQSQDFQLSLDQLKTELQSLRTELRGLSELKTIKETMTTESDTLRQELAKFKSGINTDTNNQTKKLSLIKSELQAAVNEAAKASQESEARVMKILTVSSVIFTLAIAGAYILAFV